MRNRLRPLPTFLSRLTSGRWRRSRVRALIARLVIRPRVWGALVGLAALTTGLFVGNLVAEADANRAAWGETRRVAVAGTGIAAGDVVSTRVEWIDLPRALVPDGAVDVIASEDRAAQVVSAGEVLVAVDLATARSDVGANMAALALPPGSGWPALEVGDHVDLFATFGSDPATKAASAAAVLDVTDELVTVAVDKADVSAVARAIARGTIVAARVDPTSMSEQMSGQTP